MKNSTKRKLKIILDENESKRGACYENRRSNNEGIILDKSGFGYHVRISDVEKKEEI